MRRYLRTTLHFRMLRDSSFQFCGCCILGLGIYLLIHSKFGVLFHNLPYLTLESFFPIGSGQKTLYPDFSKCLKKKVSSPVMSHAYLILFISDIKKVIPMDNTVFSWFRFLLLFLDLHDSDPYSLLAQLLICGLHFAKGIHWLKSSSFLAEN